MNTIQLRDVWEMYRIKFIIDGKPTWDNYWVLKNITFAMKKGETLAIIGENGAGKSTLLKLIAGMLMPDRGNVKVDGKVAGLLELGAGFEPEITGKENVYLIASLFGLDRGEIDKRCDQIIDFASLGKFIYAPVKCYSQGMFVRLAFSIAVHMDPDIVLIDDTLAVGDEFFQKKCIKRIFELRDQGKSIVFVSHDMNMVRRLCGRAILLREGRMVADGTVEDVLPLYSQLVGQKEGLGTIHKEPLDLVFNNGKIFLNWEGRLLTPQLGIYSTFILGDRWYSSPEADWEVVEKEKDVLIARGKFYALGLVQEWRIEAGDNYQINIALEIESEGGVEIRESCFNAMLIEDYKNWFAPEEKGVFAPFSENSLKWSDFLNRDNPQKCIGVTAGEDAEGELPSLAVEEGKYALQSRAQILNTDYFTHSRVLQYRTFGIRSYSGGQGNKAVCFAGQIMLGVSDLEGRIKAFRDQSVLSGKQVTVSFSNGRCTLSATSSDDVPLSIITTSVYAQGKEFSSEQAHWEVYKENDCRIIAKGKWPTLSAVQVWHLELCTDGVLALDVTMEIKEKTEIREQHVIFLCTERYRFYHSDYGQGEFPDEFLSWELDMVQRCIPSGAIRFYPGKGSCPVLQWEFSENVNTFAKIFNSDASKRARELRIQRVESEDSMMFLPGTYRSFSIKTNCSEDKANMEQEYQMKLEQGRLQLILEKGCGRIYWDGNEITKNLGFYTSLCCQGRWHGSSSNATWGAERNADALTFTGKWLDLPIRQHWRMEVREDSTIACHISMYVDEEIEVDRLQTNLMLSERYKEWFVGSKKGAFSSFKNNVGDDWDVVYSYGDGASDGSKVCLGVCGEKTQDVLLPTVKFRASSSDFYKYLNIVNSDVCFRGRVLQCLNRESQRLTPGEYTYFEGEIVVEGL